MLLCEMLKTGVADVETVRKVFEESPDAPVEIRACLMEIFWGRAKRRGMCLRFKHIKIKKGDL